MTNNIARRIYEHKNKLISGFTSKYKVDKLLFVETFPTAMEAITAEKKVKGWTRVKKWELIKSLNPKFSDLSDGAF